MANGAGIVAMWLDENLGSTDLDTYEIAVLILDKMLVEHSCCDTQTWQFNETLYDAINKSTTEADKPKNPPEPERCPSCQSNNFAQTSGHIVPDEGEIGGVVSVGNSWRCFDCDHRWDRKYNQFADGHWELAENDGL